MGSCFVKERKPLFSLTKSILGKLRYKLYIKWKNNLSFAYLNNEQYIDQELENLVKRINELKCIITNNPIGEMHKKTMQIYIL